MMANRVNDEHVVNAGGSWLYFDRLLGNDGAAITQASIDSISRVLTNDETGAVTTDSLTVSTVVFDSLQASDARWSAAGGSGTGYNFLDVIPASKLTSRVKHRLQYTFTPASGEIWKTNEIDVIGD